MRRLPPVALVALASLSACGDGTDDARSGPQATYDSTAAAPDPSTYTDSEVEPEAARGVVQLDLDNGTTVAIWIDPEDKRKVFQQHSDPDDPASWTSPELLYTAGDGCLFIEAATDGTTVGATLGCYEDDAFIQQAPDQGQAVATADLVDWEVRDSGQLYTTPQVQKGKVTWPEGPSWSESGGFA